MNFTFDKAEHIRRMTPHVEKLVSYLKTKGITFFPTDGELENVVFKSDKKVVKIAHHCFYRFSGMCKIRKDLPQKKIKNKKEKNYIDLVDVTDDMFINQYMKSMIDFLFFGKETG